MKLIIGLGNPGSRYSFTRHNAGRLLVEFAAGKHSASFKFQKHLKASTASIKIGTEEVLLSYPETFMNVSGEPVGLLVREFQINPESDLLVAVDEMALPFGKLRLRGQGSDGGHNGLKSIIQILASQDFPRLRIGIGPEEGEEKPDFETFVLENFSQMEKNAMPEVLLRGYQALELWGTQPLSHAMNVVNA